jgi:hypothetical protein
MATVSSARDEKCSSRELREAVLLRFLPRERTRGVERGIVMATAIGHGQTDLRTGVAATRVGLCRRVAIAILSVAIVNLGVVSAAVGAIVDTETLVAMSRDADLATIRTQLDRQEVRDQMQKMGVDASSIDNRIAALNDRELHQLAADMQSGPAGGEILALIGAVFVVLLILELVGVIDIFKKIPR